jgi:hypothetical protein
LLPRCFWFVQSAPDSPDDHIAPFLETSATAYKESKKTWRLIKRGRIENEYLFKTVLAKNLVPFAVRESHPVFVPLHSQSGAGTLNASQLLSDGKLYAAQWMKEIEQIWKTKSSSAGYLHENLDCDQALTVQDPQGDMVVLYNTSGSHLTAALHFPEEHVHAFKTNGFIADHETHYYYPDSEQEGDYLCAILNSSMVNQRVKAHREDEGSIHLLPFELCSIPRFDPRDPDHLALAEISKECRGLAKKGIGKTKGSSSNVRLTICQMTKKHLSVIDQKVAAFNEK